MLFPYGKRRHIWIYGQKSTGKTAIVESTIAQVANLVPPVSIKIDYYKYFRGVSGQGESIVAGQISNE